MASPTLRADSAPVTTTNDLIDALGEPIGLSRALSKVLLDFTLDATDRAWIETALGEATERAANVLAKGLAGA